MKEEGRIADAAKENSGLEMSDTQRPYLLARQVTMTYYNEKAFEAIKQLGDAVDEWMQTASDDCSHLDQSISDIRALSQAMDDALQHAQEKFNGR